MSWEEPIPEQWRRTVILCLVLAFMLAMPGFWTGFFVDDYYHLAVMEGYPSVGGPMDLFRFAPGNAAKIQPFMDRGLYPWWTLPEFKAAFWRPLTCLLANGDHALFGRDAFWWHVHSSLWYLALIAGVSLIFRRSLSPLVATVSLLVFTLDETHWFPVAWVANRNALIATTPVLWGMACHMKWREEGWRLGAPLSLVGYIVGLLGGEAALGPLAYLVAYEILGRRDRVTVRAAALSPAVLLVCLYLALHTAWGYGAYGSGPYIDPVEDPVAYVLNAPGRALALIAAQLVSFSADGWGFLTWFRPIQVVAGLLATAMFIGLWRALRGGIDQKDRAALRWMIPGSLLSLLPVLATFPANRLLLAASLGANVLMAALLASWWRLRKTSKTSLPIRTASWALVFIGLILPPLLWPVQSWIIGSVMKQACNAYCSAEVDPDTLPQQDVILWVAYDPLTCIYPPIIRAMAGQPFPKTWRALSGACHEHRLTRTGPASLELEVVGGSMMETEFELLVRSPRHPLKTGDQVKLAGLTVTVLECGKAGPKRIRFEFDRSLDDPGFTFLEWRDRGLRKSEVPGVGQIRILPKERGAF